ncbi:MAG: hypothetical protein NW220_19525 [Leptolyngbyaceae cyanobacterium bins.349]|nr:hypothetical protein [Leptolyngbyaceae cyanobacterium bins.349]
MLHRFSLRHRLGRWILAAIAILLGISILIATAPTQDSLLITNQADYTSTGTFAQNASPEMRQGSIRAAKRRNPNITFWGSQAEPNRSTGTLTSPEFTAPPILSVFIGGYPGNPGNGLFLEQVDNQERLTLQMGRSGNRWLQSYWRIPRSWQGKSVKLVAVDGTTDEGGGWVGLSVPLAVNELSLLQRQFSHLGLVPYYGLHFLLVLITGLPLANWLIQRGKLAIALTVMMAVLMSSVIGYIAFWAYFLNPVIGYSFSVVVLLLSGWQIWQLHRQQQLLPLLQTRDVRLPLLLMFSVGLAYLTILYLVNQGESAAELAQMRFFAGSMPPDNILPKLFADRLFEGKDPRQLFGDWRSSDRPPLQAGIVLFQRPIMVLTGNVGFHYQLLGTVLQCAWVAALWALCRTLQLTGKQQAIVMAFSIFSGFFLFNSVYLWPKLLAAAFTILTLSLLLPAIYESRPPTPIEAGLAAGSAALGMLSHGGVVFTLPAIALMLVIRPHSLWGVRSLLIGCVIYGLLIAPWSAYQKLYDPPGDRLAKWHLAGVHDLDRETSRSALAAIVNAYQQLSVPEILNHKWENVKTLVDNPFSTSHQPSQRRTKEFIHVLRGLSVLNAGWLVLLVTLFQRNPSKTTRRAQGLMLIVAFSIVFWVLVMFGPSTTVIHQGSYATMMLLFTSLAMLLTQLPRSLCYALLSLQILLFTFDWIVTASIGFGNQVMVAPNLWLGLVMLLSWAGVGVLLLEVTRDRRLMDQTATLTTGALSEP